MPVLSDAMRVELRTRRDTLIAAEGEVPAPEGEVTSAEGEVTAQSKRRAAAEPVEDPVLRNQLAYWAAAAEQAAAEPDDEASRKAAAAAEGDVTTAAAESDSDVSNGQLGRSASEATLVGYDSTATAAEGEVTTAAEGEVTQRPSRSEGELFTAEEVAAAEGEIAAGGEAEEPCFICQFLVTGAPQFLACGHRIHQDCAQDFLSHIARTKPAATIDDIQCGTCRKTAHQVRELAEGSALQAIRVIFPLEGMRVIFPL